MALEIAACPPEHQPAALRLLGIDAARIEAAQHGGRPLNFDGLLVAQRGGQVQGAVWVVVEAGRVASLMAPATVSPEDHALQADLVAAAVAHIRRDVTLVQAMIAPGPPPAFWSACGFEPLAEMVFLTAHRFPTTEPAGPLSFCAFGPDDEARLAELLTRTNHNTLDCPALEGKRQMADVLAGYRAAGEFDPQHWLIARKEDQDVGCLLLADRSLENQVELTYLGLAPEFRGRGWGVVLVQQALWQARQFGRGELSLAVDARNEPALRVYSRCGLGESHRNLALVHLLSPSRDSAG